MPTIRASGGLIVPADADAAARISAPNYDEFDSDAEVTRFIREHPDSVLGITMPHCDVGEGAPVAEGSERALACAEQNLKRLVGGGLVRPVEAALWVYWIDKRDDPSNPQIGVGGMALVSEIRTNKNPKGTIIRNELIHEAKVRGRRDLIDRTGVYIGTVNAAIDDRDGEVEAALRSYAGSRPCDFAADDELENRHRIWLVTESAPIDQLRRLLAAEPHAYVADGNHRSAAAAELGREAFLAVFFCIRGMAIAPYNRLVSLPEAGDSKGNLDAAKLTAALKGSFEVECLGGLPAHQPEQVHEIGLYFDLRWYALRPKASAYDPDDAVQCIDAEIVQRRIFADVLGIDDSRDPQVTYVGGNKSAAWLKSQVDRGERSLAITLAPVTLDQFVNVCAQDAFMPPKSTWFSPKIRSGLVIARL